MTFETREDKSLNRIISRMGFGAMNINGVIGAGIFGLPAVAAAMTGAFSPWIFVISGLLIFTVVLCFAHAASHFRNTGGITIYAGYAFGPMVGFQAGWLSYIGRVSAFGANSNLLVSYASWFWAPLDAEPFRSIILCALTTVLIWVNIRGVKSSVAVVYMFTMLKLLPLSLLILFGLGHIDLQMLSSAEIPEFGVLGETVLIVVYAFVGFEGTVVTAGEARSPRRDLPKALTQSIALIFVIYVLIQMVAVSALPSLAQSTRALTDVGGVLMGAFGTALLSLGAVFSITGNLSATVLSAPRITYALARDGTMPAALAKVHPVYHTPYVSLLFYGALCLILALTGSFVWLAVMSTLTRLLTYIVCIIAIPRLQRKRRFEEVQHRLPGGYMIPVVALFLCLWLMTYVSLAAWLTTFGFMLFGTLLYYWGMRQDHNRSDPHT